MSLIAAAAAVALAAVAPQGGAPVDDAAIRQAILRIKRGEELDPNLAVLRRALEGRPDPAAFARDVGVVLLSEKLFAPAQSFLEIARERFPADGLIAQQLGNAHTAQFHYAEGYEHLSAAETLLPPGPRPLLQQFLSLVLIGLQREDESVARATRAIEDARAYNRAAAANARLDEVDFHLNLAHVHWKFLHHDRALAVIDALDDARLEPRDRSKAWLLRAQVVDEKGEGEDEAAAAAFARQREIAPHDPAGAYELALFLVRRNQPAAARPHLERVIELDPHHEGGHFNLARVLLRLGEHERGRRTMVRYQELRDARLEGEVQLAAFRLEVLRRTQR